MTSSSAGYLPYANKAIPFASTDRLAAVARLFGLHPKAPDGCRVLDIGCARGAHLMGLAASFPAADYVGVDLDARAIRDGNDIMAALRLGRVELEAKDFRALAKESRKFDYVVAHGMYSWVGSSRVDLQACKLEYSIVSPK